MRNTKSNDNEEFDREELGKVIQKARKELGLSQKEFADQLHVSDKTISSYEVGRALPGFDVLKKMGKVLNKPITYFDVEFTSDSVDLQIKLLTIEKELLEIKEILNKQKK